MTKFLNHIKWMFVLLMLTATTCSAANETANGPSSAAVAVSFPRKTGMKMTLPMAIVLSCILTALLIICFFYFYFCHCVEYQLALAASVQHNGETGTMKVVSARGLDPAVIATFKSFSYSAVKEIKIGQQVLECAVCLNEFSDYETLRLLPECSHVFHRDCIDEWLGLHVTCPVCRANLVPKPGQLSHKTKSCFGPNESIECHVSIELLELKHDIPLARNVFRSYSMGHSFVGRPIDNIEKYTLRLPKEVQDNLENSVNNQLTSTNMAFSIECSSKTSLKSASANFARGSNYFDYERFGHERPNRSPGLTGSSNSGDDTMTTSQRFFTSVRSPLNRLFHTSDNMDTEIMKRLNDTVAKSSDSY